MFEFIKTKLTTRVRSLFGGTEQPKPVQKAPPPAVRKAAMPGARALPPKTPAAPPAPPVERDKSRVHLALEPIVQELPADLRKRVQKPTGDVMVNFPIDKIAPQLHRGMVTISFGELRQAASNIFSPLTDKDSVPVTLPLSEILAQLDNNLIRCHQSRGRIEVPEDIPGPFDLSGNGAPTENVRISGRGNDRRPPKIHSCEPQPSRAAIAAPEKAPGGIPNLPFIESSPRTLETINFSQGAVAAPRPVPAPAPAVPVAAPKPAPVKAPPAGPVLTLDLSAIWEDWPKALRSEIAQMNLSKAKVDMPLDAVGEGLKRGQVVFTWRTLRTWIKPPVSSVSAHDLAELILPLEKIAPLFLSKSRKSAKKAELQVDESIPAVFETVPVPGAAPKPAIENDRNGAVSETIETTPVMVQPSRAPAQTIPAPPLLSGDPEPMPAEPAGTEMTPHMAVFRATALEGVAGALVALNEGLPVASRLPREMDAEMLSAFLPKIFRMMSENVRDLKSGQLTRLVFNLDGVPWELFRLRTTLFAVVGFAEKPLPEKELIALTADMEAAK